MSVLSLSIAASHEFTKQPVDSIVLIKDLGIQGDCHYGETVQHRSRLKIVPKPKNLRQVHLIPWETLQDRGLKPGDIGENITTIGLDLLNMSAGTRLRFVPSDDSSQRTQGNSPVIILTGVRNPCPQIEKFRKGLQETFIVRDEDRKIVKRLAGVMAVVELAGTVLKGMTIIIEPPVDFVELEPV